MALRVLIVDDLDMMRRIVTRWLWHFGANLGLVVEASDGREALDALERNPVDLIFCDLKMPRMSGLEFLQNLRQREEWKKIPVIIISAAASRSNVLEAAAAGASGFLCKPFTTEEFSACVGPVLESLGALHASQHS
jgi:two-component system chemotaxis response regulator CheY